MNEYAGMHRRVSVSAMSSAQWSFDEDLHCYEKLGITQVGLSFDKILKSAGGSLDRVEQVAGRVCDRGLTVTNMLGLGVFNLAAPESWPAQHERFLAAVGVGAAVGAECLVALSGPAWPMSWEDAADALVEASQGFVAAARRSGVEVCLEHTNALRMDVSFLHTLADTVDLAERMGLGVCMDVSACWNERRLGTTVTSASDRFRPVQISDWVVGTRCTPDRAVPGDGNIPLRRIMSQLLEAGYAGAFDLEVLGPTADAIGYESVIARGVAWLGEELDALGVAR